MRINLYEEEPFFEYNLTFPIICASFFGEDDLRVGEKNNIPMGTGMYKLQSVDLNSQLELKLNPTWWNLENKKPRIEKINVKIYASISEVYNAYKLGSIDLIGISKYANVEQRIGTIGYNTKQNYGREFDYLALNCERDILKNKEIRQAISYGVNRQDIVNTVYGEKYVVADFPLEYGSYLYNKEISNYEYNQDKAKQILQENGWEFTYNYWQKKIERSTVRIKLNLLVNSANENRVNVANIIKTNLEDIGMQVNVIAVKDRAYDNYIANKNYDILLTGVTVRIKS